MSCATPLTPPSPSPSAADNTIGHSVNAPRCNPPHYLTRATRTTEVAAGPPAIHEGRQHVHAATYEGATSTPTLHRRRHLDHTTSHAITSAILRATGIVLLMSLAVIHIVQLVPTFQQTPLLGVAYLVLIAATVVVGARLVKGHQSAVQLWLPVAALGVAVFVGLHLRPDIDAPRQPGRGELGLHAGNGRALRGGFAGRGQYLRNLYPPGRVCCSLCSDQQRRKPRP